MTNPSHLSPLPTTSRQIEDLPPLPTLDVRQRIKQFLGHLLPDRHGTAVFLLSRPGRTSIDAGERRWAQFLLETVRRANLPTGPVHLANDLELVVAPDDLAATA